LIKKSMDIIDVYAWVSLHREGIRNCVVDNAYRSKYYWLLKLVCRGESRLLKVEPAQRLHFSRSEPSVKSIDKFTSYLRAHVRDGKITSISQPWWERVVVLETVKQGRALRHYVEIVPRGLWVVADSDDKILYATRFEEFRDRVIKVGVKYTPPPPKGLSPLTSSTSSLVEALLAGRDLVRGIVSEWGLPGYIAEELLARTGLYGDKYKKPSEVPRSDLERVAEEYYKLVEESLRGYGYLVKHNNIYELYTAYYPRLFEEVFDREVVRVDLDSAIDAYFTELEAHLELEERRRKLEEALEAHKRRVEEQVKSIEELRREYSEIAETLRAIYENYNYIYEVFECAVKVRSARGWEAVRECGPLRVERDQGLVCIELPAREVCLSIRKSLEEQVVELEKKRGELAGKIERAERALAEMVKEGVKIEEELRVEVRSRPSPRFWFEKFRWTITRNGFLVIAGKDASQNEAVVRKYLEDRDIFLHADIHGAPATVLLVRGGRTPALEDILDAAVIAACYSKAWKTGFSYIDVYWVYGSQVSKTPPSGEYLTKGAFMVYGERRYLRVPLVLGVGLRLFCDEVYGDYVKVFAGSPEVVKESSISYTLVVPGDLSVNDAKREVTRILVEEAKKRTGVLYANIEESVESVLPGSLRVIEWGPGRGLCKCEL
jgi:predicted ribosome quality control (RQC) complex YloA/Tae2 family protein